MDWSTSAKLFADARLKGVRMDEPPRPDPQNPEEAYALQDAVTAALGYTVIGWKVGATNPAAQSALGAKEPFVGPIYAECTYENEADIATSPDALRVPEAEFALKLSKDLPPRGAAYGADEAAAAIASVHPAIEIVNKRLAGDFGDSINRVIADGGANQAFVYGTSAKALADLDLPNHALHVSVNGVLKAEGIGSNVMGSPVMVLAWLATHMSKRGVGLKAGQWISTGLTTPIFQVRLGDEVRADFGSLGTVSARFPQPSDPA